MRRFFVVLALLLFGGWSTIQSYQPVASGPAYVGVLDTYPTGATWCFSTWKCNNSYAGNWGTVQRQSDNATQAIGWDTNSRANVTTFNTFCASTNCYLTTGNDQKNTIDATQATLANMPRVIVDSNTSLAVCGTPTSIMTTAFNAAVNTAKVHGYFVANAGYIDNRWSQSGLPTTTVTGNITSGSATISSMSSQVGISASSNTPHTPAALGITENRSVFPVVAEGSTTGGVFVSALPTGTTGTLSFSPGSLSPTGNGSGATLIFTNAVMYGAWIMNGPAGATLSTAYWSMGLGGDATGSPADWYGRRAGATGVNALQAAIGEGMRGRWAVYDFDTSTTHIYYDGTDLGSLATTGNVTYSTNVGMTLFANNNSTENASQNCFETIILYDDTGAQSRTAVSSFLQSQSTAPAFTFAPTTSDGFTMTGWYQPNDFLGTASAYGYANTFTDALGMTWASTAGGYTWPSAACANNINNSTTLCEFIVQQGDSDEVITSSERSEYAASLQVAPGGDFSIAYQFRFDTLPSQTGSWCYLGQVHNNNAGGNNAPTLTATSCLNGQLQIVTQKGNVTTTNCGSAVTLTVGTTYAVVISGHWSTNHTSDTFDEWIGVNGTTLTHQCSTSGALWNNDTGAYLKQGVYRGDPWGNAGTAKLRMINAQMTLSANAYSAYITNQPALPTHP